MAEGRRRLPVAGDREHLNRALDVLARTPNQRRRMRRKIENDTREMLTEHWDYVEAVAAALLAEGTLDETRFFDALDAAYAARTAANTEARYHAAR